MKTVFLHLLLAVQTKYRSGQSASQDMEEDFTDYVQEPEEPLLDSLETSDADSESSDERRYLGTGLLVGAAAVGIISFSNMLGRSAGNGSDDLRAVLSEAVDVDDVKTSLTLGSDACKASAPL
jgi:hypothetical protein